MFLSTSNSHGLMYFRNAGNVRNICNLISTTKRECIKLTDLVIISSIIQRMKYSTGYSDDIGSDLLYIYLHKKWGVFTRTKSEGRIDLKLLY